jgi:hypothetical protein
MTLVEMMVAIFVVGLVLMALASTLMTSLRSVQGSERVVRSTQLGNEIVEELLAVPYDQLGLYSGEAQNVFGAATFEGAALVLFPNYDGYDADDPTNRDPVVPVVERSVTRDGITYDIRTAIVWVEAEHSLGDVEPKAYKRIVVDLAWTLRGQERTARVEGMQSSEPSDRNLSVSVTPDVIPLSASPEGKNGVGFLIDVFAEEPQSIVRVEWRNRAGTLQTSDLNPVPGTDGHQWRLPFNANTRHFANGGTRFEVTAIALDGQRTTTTVGRATFLHALQIDLATLLVEPSVLEVHPTLGPCTGLSLEVEVIGAVLSDPLLISVDGGPQGPTEALETTVPGSRYGIAYDADDLAADAADGQLILQLQALRSADAAAASLNVDVTILMLQEGESCSAS